MEKFIGQVVESAGAWLPGVIGGLIDYLNQIMRGEKKWSIFSFAVHIVSAGFFGWMTGTLAGGMDYSGDIILASCGLGGYLGVRVADLVTYKFIGIDQRKD